MIRRIVDVLSSVLTHPVVMETISILPYLAMLAILIIDLIINDEPSFSWTRPRRRAHVWVY